MVDVRDLSFQYGKTAPKILDGVSFCAASGKMTALIGANGAGKSTLLKNVAGLLKGGGEIVIDGRGLAAWPREELARRISYLAQGGESHAVLNVFEVVLLGRMHSLSFRVSDADTAAVERILERLGIAHLASRNIGALSGGQRQLAFIAQALAKGPDILLLDEPTSALDLHRQFELLTLLQALTAERQFTTVMTLHHLDLAARFADEIVVLSEGHIYAHGTPADVFTERMLRDVYRVRAKIYVDDDGARHVITSGAVR